ncbi:MAG: metallophosphatase [Myxococcales bacterium SG8_38_1]|jgi:predicted phosphodiesterase|nr:MAG: metallophosphatase [Myxococcales bacterium SG8_38_1]
MSTRTLIVGDIHGCREELEDLLEESEWAEGDQLVSVGDLVAKGPDSLGVVRLFRELDGLAVRGNHDQHCLRWWDAKRAHAKLPQIKPAHQRVADELGEEDWAWLAALPLWIELEERDALVVHAGLVPDLSLEDQDPYDLMNMRSILSDGSASRSYEEGTPWAALWTGPRLVVFGHDAVRGLQMRPHAIGLDTGCVYGGWLTGVWLPGRDLVSVPARGTYAQPGKD